MESGMQLKESTIPLTIGNQNPSSTDRDWNPIPGIRNADCLGCHYTRQLYPAYETAAHKIGLAKGWFMLCERMAVYFD